MKRRILKKLVKQINYMEFLRFMSSISGPVILKPSPKTIKKMKFKAKQFPNKQIEVKINTWENE